MVLKPACAKRTRAPLACDWLPRADRRQLHQSEVSGWLTNSKLASIRAHVVQMPAALKETAVVVTILAALEFTFEVVIARWSCRDA